MPDKQPVTYEQFGKIYQEVVTEVLQYWTMEMQAGIARHCYGWSPGLFDFTKYLRASVIRYYKAYLALVEAGDSVCDVGGFWGVFPITLVKLGYDVTMTEALQYYDTAFDPLFGHIRKQGVKILDYDPFEQDPPFVEEFDFVSVMAVLEHYPHSLRRFMSNVRMLAKKSGSIYLEVPNVAYLPKRVTFFLFGQTPYTPIRQIYESAVPFIGHHHEFTMAELKDVAQLSGLKVVKELFYNYWRGDYSAPGNVVRRPHEWLVFSLWKSVRECLAIVCKRT